MQNTSLKVQPHFLVITETIAHYEPCLFGISRLYRDSFKTGKGKVDMIYAISFWLYKSQEEYQAIRVGNNKMYSHMVIIKWLFCEIIK